MLDEHCKTKKDGKETCLKAKYDKYVTIFSSPFLKLSSSILKDWKILQNLQTTLGIT